MRPVRTFRAGCVTCHGTEDRWTGANALAVAARHNRITGHPTWCDLSVHYGSTAFDPRQTDIEDAIASTRSGGEPEAAPLTDPEPADPPTSRCNPKAAPIGTTPRSMKERARGRKPEIHP